jgi:long-chain acyl-CoA synthetase
MNGNSDAPIHTKTHLNTDKIFKEEGLVMNLSTVLDHCAVEYQDKTAIICDNHRLSFGQLNAMANQIANGLAASGIEKGDKVALSCPNLPYFPMVYYAILKTGATVVPLNVLFKRREITYHLKDSDAVAYFCFQGTDALPVGQEGVAGFEEVEACKQMWMITADPAAESPHEGIQTLGQMMSGKPQLFETVFTSPLDTAVILYTSGTTGSPKGAELSHSNLFMNATVLGDLFGLLHDDIHAVALPLFHSFGQTVQMNAGFLKGNTLVLVPRFSPEAILSAIQEENVSIFAGVPTMYWQLLTYEDKEDRYDIEKISKTLRIGMSGGASLPLEIIKGIEEKYGIPIFEGYGLSETSPVSTFNHPVKERKPGSIGTALWGVDVKVFDKNKNELPPGEIGEVVIRGHNVMKGYYNKPEATAEAFTGDSWFHTGDLGKMDEDRYFYIVDREKDMVIRGGYNVYPREIEEVLMTHPAVSLVAVIGVPHNQHGEEVKAYVVPKQGATVDAATLIQWAKERMAAYKYPRVLEFRENLPMTATGKILKKELKAEFIPA